MQSVQGFAQFYGAAEGCTCDIAKTQFDTGSVRSPSGQEFQGRPSQNAVTSEMRPYLLRSDRLPAIELRIVARHIKTDRWSIRRTADPALTN
jgi:hypothetical protein